MAIVRGGMASSDGQEEAPDVRQVWSDARVASGEWRVELVVPKDPMEVRGEALLLSFIGGTGVEKGLRFPVDTHSEISVEVVPRVVSEPSLASACRGDRGSEVTWSDISLALHQSVPIDVSAGAGVNVSPVWDVVLGYHGYSARRFTASRFESAEAAQQLASVLMRALGVGTGKPIVVREAAGPEHSDIAGETPLSAADESLSNSSSKPYSERAHTRDWVSVLKLSIVLCVLILCGVIYVIERKPVRPDLRGLSDSASLLRPSPHVDPSRMGRLEDLPAPAQARHSR